MKERLTGGEFIDWLAFLELDANGFHREDHYFAQIALEMRRSYAKDANKYDLKDFILTFRREKTNKPVNIKSATKQSMVEWFTIAGFKEGLQQEWLDKELKDVR